MLPVTPAEIDAMSDEPRRTESDAAFVDVDDAAYTEEQRRYAQAMHDLCGPDEASF